MTSTTDTTGHPDVAEISDLTEGLLPPSRSADLRRHSAAASCARRSMPSLEEIRGLLGTAGGSPRDARRTSPTGSTPPWPPRQRAGSRPSPPSAEPHVSRETQTVTGSRPATRSRTTTGPGRSPAGVAAGSRARVPGSPPRGRSRRRVSCSVPSARLGDVSPDKAAQRARHRASPSAPSPGSAWRSQVTELLHRAAGTADGGRQRRTAGRGDGPGPLGAYAEREHADARPRSRSLTASGERSTSR